MPEFAKYELWLCDYEGNAIRLLTGDDMLSFAWQHRLNEPGIFALTLVAETNTKDVFKPHYGVKLMRNHGDSWYEEYYGFYLDESEWETSGEVDEHYWSALGLSPEWLLDQPLLTPPKEVLNPDPYGDGGDEMLARYDVWWMHGAADDVMKTMVSESMGVAADANRQFSNFSVQGMSSKGAWDCYEDRYPRLLEAVRDLSGERGQTDFGVVRVDGGFEFRTYSPYYGTDRRLGHSDHPTIFSKDMGNMLDPKLHIGRRNLVTDVYGGWEGGNEERLIYADSDPDTLSASPYRRREMFIDLRDVKSEEAVSGQLAQALMDNGEVVEVTFTPLQTAGNLYRRDWDLGDLCTAVLWGNTYDVRITEVAGRIDGKNEEEIMGKAELWTRKETVE